MGAKFPWMTVSGEEMPHAFWECVIGEIHINTAVSYGIWHYLQATEDNKFLIKYGAEILVETARFWADRVGYSRSKKQYIINQVTGPDEYMPMINNNCYTNSMVQWSLEYTCSVVESLKKYHKKEWKRLSDKISFNSKELKKWKDIIKKIYIPFDEKLNLHPQDDTFLALDHIDLKDISNKERPLEINWPFEKIMRYDVLKQPDVVLMIYLINDRYSRKVKKADYEFYEPRTIHDSSLSPCIHSIIASEIGKDEDAYYYALRSVRLDLENYNNNTEQGVHIASTSGAWMTFVNGFGGMRIREGQLCFAPKLPAKWQKYMFKVNFRDRVIEVEVTKNRTVFYLKKGDSIKIKVKRKTLFLEKGKKVEV
jgi:trehalose/maltose hydrolase-like predicted phosphorylase